MDGQAAHSFTTGFTHSAKHCPQDPQPANYYKLERKMESIDTQEQNAEAQRDINLLTKIIKRETSFSNAYRIMIIIMLIMVLVTAFWFIPEKEGLGIVRNLYICFLIVICGVCVVWLFALFGTNRAKLSKQVTAEVLKEIKENLSVNGLKNFYEAAAKRDRTIELDDLCSFRSDLYDEIKNGKDKAIKAKELAEKEQQLKILDGKTL